MNQDMNWKKLWMLIYQFFELQNEFTKMRIKDLGEWMEEECTCPTCLSKKVEASWEDGEPSFDDKFKEEWE